MQSQNRFDLSSRVAVVVGGVRDLGKDMAEALAEAGCDLVVTSRDANRAEAQAAELREAFDCDALGLGLDVCDAGAIKEVAAKAIGWKSRIDVLVNNAGGNLGQTRTSLFDRDADDIRQLLDTNVTGPLLCCQAFGRQMVKQGSGSIVNIGSIAGLVGRDRRLFRENGLTEQAIDYAAAKAAVIGMTRDLAMVLAPHGVRVNTISPGGFERSQPRPFIDDYAQEIPLGRLGRDGFDMKGAVVFLASDASSYITGHNLVLDGGFTSCR
jgi:NAD(P)-dependent dehydrogenase (short-subunit alcohol dehydrogenase family)